MHRRLGLVLGLIVGMLGAGCASTSYSKLKDEDAIPELAALKAQALAHAKHTTKVETCGCCTDAPPVKVAIHQMEKPGHDKLIVFIHGVFSDSTAWRFIAGDLAADHDLWLVDLPGCGESDKPDPAKMGREGYTPTDLASPGLDAIRDRLAARGGDQRFCIVAHSLGAMVALRMFADERVRARHGDVLARVDRMILSAPVDVELHRPDPFFEE